jgi:hypothetical protein
MTKTKFDTPDPEALVQQAIKQRSAAEEARNRKNLNPDPDPAEPRPKDAPVWSPQGADLDLVPPEIRQAITELIQPLYEQYVLHAKDALEKSLGASMAHLLWLEVLDQFDIRREYIQFDAVINMTMNRPAMIERHLRLLGSKLQIGYFLLRVKELRTRLAQHPHPSTLLSDYPPPDFSRLAGKLPVSDCPNSCADKNGTVPFNPTNTTSDCPHPPVVDATVPLVDKNETASAPSALDPANNCEPNQSPPPDSGKIDVWSPKTAANTTSDCPDTPAADGTEYPQRASVPSNTCEANRSPPPDPGKIDVWSPKTAANTTSDSPDPPVADGTAYPPSDFTPTDDCEADHAPPPDPGNIDDWSPKNARQP